MPDDDLAAFALCLENALLTKRGQAFQDFFAQAATALWGADFVPWRAQGPLGDMKCDGYRKSNKAVFQCYAPISMEASKVERKIRDDFDGARANFGDRMENWVFVHNQSDALPATTNLLIFDLMEAHPNITIETWTSEYLRLQLLQLPSEKRRNLFPIILEGLNFTDATWAVLENRIRERRATAIGPVFESQQFDNRLSLDDTLDDLAENDREVRRRLLGYSRWYEPGSKAKINLKLAQCGYEDELIESNARRLDEARLIRITDNHYLPLSEEICQQAAETLMDEFLRELEE